MIAASWFTVSDEAPSNLSKITQSRWIIWLRKGHFGDGWGDEWTDSSQGWAICRVTAYPQVSLESGRCGGGTARAA